MEKKIAFIGAGSMAEAIISGIVSNQFIKNKQVIVTNRSNQKRLLELEEKYGVRTSTSVEDTIKSAEIVILAMKPYAVRDAIKNMKAYVKKEQLIVSVLAGITTDFIAKEIGQDIAVVRVMPNTSAMIGHSATTIASGTYANAQQEEQVKKLMDAIGKTVVIDEKDMHASTALAGSGPAFYYYMVEAMETAAKQAGLDEAVAKQLIVQTIVGAAEMLKSTEENPAQLRKNITSPGGTTEAGLKVLADYQFQEAIIACVKQAAERSRQLSEM